MRWLQLCDFHFGRNDEAQAVAMANLVEAINVAMGEDPVDAVIFAGDVADTGSEDDYQTAIQQIVCPLKDGAATKDAKFISVPGNHDLDCTDTLPITWSGLGKSRQSLFWYTDERGINLRKGRAEGFEAYSRFLKKCNILGPDPLTEVGAMVKIPARNPATVICLNASLFSDKDLSEEEEAGKSPLPVHTLRQLAQPQDLKGQIFVVGHHPTRWFEAQSRQHFMSTLVKMGAVYLHGHEHKIEATFGAQSLKTFGFGATYPSELDSGERQPYTSSFAVCQLEDKLHVKFVSWEPEHGVWRPFHSLQGDFYERSDLLSDGYVVTVPSTRLSTVERTQLSRGRRIGTRPKVAPPIWIEGNSVETWATLLRRLDLITPGYSITEDEVQNIAGHSKFFISDQKGTHLIHAAVAETSYITYDHVESANTQLDALRLSSCTILTLGALTEKAANLADTLRGTKKLRVLNGLLISEMLSESAEFTKHIELFDEVRDELVFTPIVLGQDVGLLAVDAVRNKWFSIVDASGRILSESEEIFNTICNKLPHLRHIEARLPDGLKTPRSVVPAAPFDKQAYLSRCMTLFDTASYTGLAAIGVRLPIESLRRIYVPTSANVEQRRTALEATERAIEDLVETLGLDERQREQLSRQMKTQYGLQQASEVSMASQHYHNFSNVVVLGDPGSGKTCFVRTEIMSYCEANGRDTDNWYDKHVPIFLPLAEYTYSADNPQTLLVKCICHAHGQGLKVSHDQLEILMSRGLVAFFFDGLDEIGSIVGRERALEEINNLVAEYAMLGNRFVLTSRPAAVRDVQLPKELTRLSLLGLTNHEIKMLAHRLFAARYREDQDISQRDREVIDEILKDCEEKPGIRRLARNPLLLTLLVFIYENSGAFAARRHLIYSQAVKTLVSVRHREIRRAMLSESDLRVRLGKLAVAVFGREASALPSRREALSIFQGALEGNGTGKGDFIQNVAETTGLLIVDPRTPDRNEDLVSFMHHSFLEYYTALGCLEDEDALQHVFDIALNTRWQEVVTLMFGIKGEQADITDWIVEICRSRNQSDDITVDRLKLAFDCAWECDVPPEPTQRVLANRLVTLMSKGPGLYVADVREELAKKVELSLQLSESDHLRKVILQGIRSEDDDVAAAFVDLAAKMHPYSDEDEQIIASITESFSRAGRSLRISVVDAMSSLPSLRSSENLAIVRRILERGGNIEKGAVLQVLDEEVALVPKFASELRGVLYGDVNFLAGCSSRMATVSD